VEEAQPVEPSAGPAAGAAAVPGADNDAQPVKASAGPAAGRPAEPAAGPGAGPAAVPGADKDAQPVEPAARPASEPRVEPAAEEAAVPGADLEPGGRDEPDPVADGSPHLDEAPGTASGRPKPTAKLVAGAGVGVAVAVAVAVVAALLVGLTGPGSHPAHGGALTGQILSFTDTSVVLSAPNGAVPTPVPALSFARLEGLLVSGDGRYLASATGRVLAIHDRTFSAISAPVRFPAPTADWAATGLADHDRQLVIERGTTPGLQQIDAISIAENRTTALGQADTDAGDPQAVGVFAAVGSRELLSPPPGPPLAGDPVVVDSQVERRDAGQAPVILATAGQLAEDLGASSSLAVRIKALPDPAGDKVALTVTPVAAGGPALGIVVVDRNGKALGVTRPAAGLGDAPGWSPDGRSLVYDSITPAQRVEISVWRIGRQPYVRPGPLVTPILGVTYSNSCLWASDGSGVLCTIGGSSGPDKQTWIMARPTSGDLQTVTIGLDPLGWLR
jgi:hypothetical protein